MADNENTILRRFAEYGDSEAFNQLVQEHSGLVYGTCLRILGDQNLAADATQETFFQLLRNAKSISGSVSSWLHKVATGKSIDLIRSDSRRRGREAKYAGEKKLEVEKWEDLSVYIDEALNELDDQSREILIMHFFENKTMAAIAAQTGLSQPTISRRVESALSRLADKLYKKGVIMATAAMGALLLENAAQAAPAFVLRELGKMVLVSGAAQTAAATGAGVGGAGAAAAIGIKAKILIATTIAAVGIGGGVVTYKVVYRNGGASNPTAVSDAQNSRLATVAVNGAPAGGAVYGDNYGDMTAGTYGGGLGGYGGNIDGSGAMGYGGGYGGGNVPITGGMAFGNRGTTDENQQTVGTAVVATGGRATVAMGFGGGMAAAQKVTVDLSGPDKTIESFSKLLASGNFGRLSECFVPGAQDYTDIVKALQANTTENAAGKLLYSSIGEPIEITDVTSDETAVTVKWTFTVTKPFTIEGKSYQPGDKVEFDATVIEAEGKWLIKGI